MKNLPIGISTFSTIIENNMIYVDKTKIALNLIQTTGRYFLSRPRRFGKSLLLDTLKEIFDCNKTFFKGFFIYDNWPWDIKYPVIKIDFAGGTVRNRDELDVKLREKLDAIIQTHNLSIKSETVSGIFNELINALFIKYQTKVILLVDEYDKPLLDNIENPEIAMEVRDGLKNFYSVIKEQDANIQFVFLTGVSKFSKVNIFSGINNLQDITLDENYATICGYTQNDLETDFKEHLDGVNRDELKSWYNGYNFLGEKVYNPFDILLFISNNHSFRNYWFETGTPTFLIKLFQKNNYFLPNLDDIEVGESIISSFDIENIEPTALLFQSGYLTIKEVTRVMGKLKFKLQFPNFEVKTSFNEYLIGGYTFYTIEKMKLEESIYNSIQNGDFDALEKTITRLFAGIPYRNFTKNRLHEYEGYYASVLYAFFSAINCEVIPEDITNHGQADMTIKLGDVICVMEIKVLSKSPVEPGENSALKQIQTMDYAAKYIGSGKKVYELGMVFDMEKRNLVAFDWSGRFSRNGAKTQR